MTAAKNHHFQGSFSEENTAFDPLREGNWTAQAVQIKTMIHDSVLSVHQLNSESRNKPSVLTRMLMLFGVSSFFVGVVFQIMGGAGFGLLLLFTGIALGLYGFTRYKDETTDPHFALGDDPKSTVHFAHPAIPAGYFPLIKTVDRDFRLFFTPSMQGEVTCGAERLELMDLIQTARARPSNDFPLVYAFDIPAQSRIRIDLGETTFQIDSVTPSPRLSSPLFSQVDWSVHAYHGLSFVVHAIVLGLVFAIPPDAKAISLDLFNTDNHMLDTFVRPAVMKKIEEIPPWLKQHGPENVGEPGKRHKSPEGKMGSPQARRRRKRYAISGPKQNVDIRLARKYAEATAKKQVLGLLGPASGSRLHSLFGSDSALGHDAEEALGGLIGNEIGEDYGINGLGILGTGNGGGGDGEGTVGKDPWGHIGLPGGKGGTGIPRVPWSKMANEHRPTIPEPREKIRVKRGSLDKELIRRVVRQHINEIKYCYQVELQHQPNLKGRIVVQFTISGAGQVVISKISSSTLNNTNAETCITQAVRRWAFPKPKDGGIVVVSYPFVLHATGGN